MFVMKSRLRTHAWINETRAMKAICIIFWRRTEEGPALGCPILRGHLIRRTKSRRLSPRVRSMERTAAWSEATIANHRTKWTEQWTAVL